MKTINLTKGGEKGNGAITGTIHYSENLAVRLFNCGKKNVATFV